jgi:hypothetical protein
VGVPIAGSLLVIAIDLADERIDIHNKSFLTRAGTGGPGP